MRRNIDAWWPVIEAGAEAIAITASACAAEVKEYAEHLEHDPAYARKAERVSSLTRDLSEIVAAEDCSGLAPARTHRGESRSIHRARCSTGRSCGAWSKDILERAGASSSPG